MTIKLLGIMTKRVTNRRHSDFMEDVYDFLIEGGDCEDYATAKYFMLVELGIEVSDLRVVVTYSDKLFGYHAVLALRQPDNSIWLLDSNYPIKKNSHMGYRWIYAMNEQAVWDHRKVN